MTATGLTRHSQWSGYLLGFALGGFFDGILLHQVLQWHHLLSTINPDNMRFQVAADGYFHALMYVIAAIGMWKLWASGPASGRLLAAGILMGFGTWHVLDGVLSHWLLGIHRIRMDTDNRLFWDLLWFGLFGLLPLFVGWLVKREGGGPPMSRLSKAGTAILVIGVGLKAFWGASPEFTTVLFAPGTGQEQVFRAIASADGQLVWSDAGGELVLVRFEDRWGGLSLFRHGAIFVGGGGLPPGCFNYLRT